MLRFALALALCACAGSACGDFMIAPIVETGNWRQTDMPPAPPLTVFTEFSKPDGVDPIRATVSDLDYLETGLHRLSASNASSYGFAWDNFLSALVDPAYSEWAIGWQTSQVNERFLIRWTKPTSATVTE